MQLKQEHIIKARVMVISAKATACSIPNNQEMVLANMIQMMEVENPLKSISMAYVIPDRLNMSLSLFRKILSELRKLEVISKEKVKGKLVYTLNK